MSKVHTAFISYARDDRADFEMFRKHLRQIEHSTGLVFWADPDLRAGEIWKPSIEQALDQASAIVILLSPAFFSSDFIVTEEIPRIQLRHESDGVPVYSVVLDDCDWQTLVPDFQAAPRESDGRVLPIRDWEPISKGYNRVREELAFSISRDLELLQRPLLRARRDEYEVARPRHRLA